LRIGSTIDRITADRANLKPPMRPLGLDLHDPAA
jgi:hypothetical protein